MRCAASIQPQLLGYIRRLAKDRALPAAEITRRAGERAWALGLHRPSYAGVRLLVRDVRMYPEEPSYLRLALDAQWGALIPFRWEDKYTGLLTKHLPEDAGL
jgi:hypothetical protein